MNKYDLIISGGGIAGLVSALGIAPLNKRILILEQNNKIGLSGADVLKPSGIAVLEELNILNDVLKKNARRREKVEIFYNGDLIDVMEYAKNNDTPYFYLAPYQIIASTVLEKLAQFSNVEVRFNTEITNFEIENNNVNKITLSDNETVEADLIIGADGLNSKVRNLLEIQIDMHHYTQQMHFGQFPLVKSVDEMNRLYVDKDGAVAYFYPINYSEFRAVIGFNKEEGREYFNNTTSVDNLLHRIKKFVSFSDDAIEMINDLNVFRTFPLTKMNSKSYVKYNCVLIGNAAHSIHPISGQGMNLAIEDAGELIKQLKLYFKGIQPLKDALNSYEKTRHPINEKVVEYGHRLATSFGSLNSFASALNLKVQTSSRKQEELKLY